ncbi:MAG: carbonic anhydrase [Tepidiformaceae bacterium]
MSVIDEFVHAGAAYADSFSKGRLPMPPARKAAIVVCMDARIDPARLLGLEEGDAHVIRNAGGRVSEALRSLAISQLLLGTEAVAVIHHTDCGMLTFNDASIRKQLRESLNADADDIAFLPFTNVEESVRADLEAYRRSSLVRHDISVRGFIYDVTTGGLREVDS